MKKTFTLLLALFFIFPIVEKCTDPGLAQEAGVFTEDVPEYKVSLQWERNQEPYIVHYKLFFRETNGKFDFDNPIWQGPQNEAEVTITHNGFFALQAIAFYENTFIDSPLSIETFEGRINPPAQPHVPNIKALERIDKAIEEISTGVQTILGNMGIPIDCNDPNIDPGVRASATYRIKCNGTHEREDLLE